MRITVTLDADVELMLNQAMRERGEPFKRVLNDAVRQGLRRAGATSASPFRQLTFSMGKSLVDLTNATALAAELEDQALIARRARKTPRRK